MLMKTLKNKINQKKKLENNSIGTSFFVVCFCP